MAVSGVHPYLNFNGTTSEATEGMMNAELPK